MRSNIFLELIYVLLHINGLDKESVKFFREKLKELKNAVKTIILTSHYEEDIKALCDKVYEMEDGELKDFKNF